MKGEHASTTTHKHETGCNIIIIVLLGQWKIAAPLYRANNTEKQNAGNKLSQK